MESAGVEREGLRDCDGGGASVDMVDREGIGGG